MMDPDLRQKVADFEAWLRDKGVGLTEWDGVKTAVLDRLAALSMSAAAATARTPKSSRFPKPGDKVMAEYVRTWQYFDATVDSFDPEKQVFHITWDDGDSAGRSVGYADVALNQPPEEDDIGEGSSVLFAQGRYKAEVDRLGGWRWHLGVITSIKQGPNSTKLYSGRHAKGEADGKFIASGYKQTFEDYTLDQLRISPNILEAYSERDAAAAEHIDVYISYCATDTFIPAKGRGAEDPYSLIKQEVLNGPPLGQLKYNKKCSSNMSMAERASMIQSAKVLIACISANYAKDPLCQQEFQFAKKSLAMPVIPMVVGNDFSWVRTIVGLLIAGELYIHFEDEAPPDKLHAKKAELIAAINNSQRAAAGGGAAQGASIGATMPKDIKKQKCDVFVSYCWMDSRKSFLANQVPEAEANRSEWSDPRRVKEVLAGKYGIKVWLDIEQLATSDQSGDNVSMFEQIANGLLETQLVLAFVSDKYSASKNCQMEFQYAVKSMHKQIVPIPVGHGDNWKRSVVGMLVSGQENEPIPLLGVVDEDDFNDRISQIKRQIDKFVTPTDDVDKEEGDTQINVDPRVPQVGDHVISHWKGAQFFFSTIASFDRDTLTYTVDWDDGDTSGRECKYSKVAKDIIPDVMDLGVGTEVLFPQGRYKLDTSSDQYSGFRYFEGVITDIQTQPDGTLLYSGHHNLDPDQVPRFQGVKYTFENLTYDQLRLAPNAFDTMTALG